MQNVISNILGINNTQYIPFKNGILNPCRNDRDYNFKNNRDVIC